MYLKLSIFSFLTLVVNVGLCQNLQWELYANQGAYQNYDINYTVKTDDQGNIYTASYFQNSVTVGGQVLYVEGNNQDMVITKHNENRELVWFKEIDLNYGNYYLGFDIDSNGDLIVASSITDTFFIDDFVILPETEKSGFIAKINKSGKTEWVRKVFDGFPTIHNLSVFNNNIFVTGESWNGGFFARLDGSGNTIWKRNIDEGNNVWGSDIQLAPDGSTYGVIMFQSNQIKVTEDITLYNPYSWGIQMVLFKFDTQGELIWYTQNAQGKFLEDVKFDIDEHSNVYLVGNYNNAALELGSLELPSPSGNKSIGFIAKCTAEGEWEWLTERGPWPNISRNIEFDCQNEVIYSTGLKSLEVYSILGSLESQLLFDEDFTRCHSLEIGNDDNILLSGVTRDSIISKGKLNANSPFVVSVDYNSAISNLSCITTSVSESRLMSRIDHINIYPTIYDGEIIIESSGLPLNDFDLIVSSIDGKLLYSETVSAYSAEKVSIRIGNMPNGISIVTIVSEYGVLSKRMLVKK